MEEQNIIRNYLLGTLSDEDKMRQIEENSLLDDRFAQEISIAESELIDDYLDGALSDAEREQFDRFFLVSPERKQQLRLSQNLRKYAAKAKTQPTKESPKEKSVFFNWRNMFASPALRFAVIALIFCGLSFAIWRAAFYQSDVDKGLAQLQIAYRGQRPVESRTTVGFDYAPLTITRGNERTIADSKARDRAERLLLDATEDTDDARAHHALGLFYLAERQFDKALKEFNLALKLAPDDAKLHSDAGAAYSEKAALAEREEKSDEFFANADAALKHLNRALELNENLREALFNKALILQKMGLTNEAQKVWQQYLEKDSVSPWADEARRNLQRLEEQKSSAKTPEQVLQDFFAAYERRDDERAWEIVSQTKEMITGTMVFFQLTQGFLKADANKETEKADKYLAALRYVGELEKTRAGDSFFAEIAGFYAVTDRQDRKLLAQAQSQLGVGYRLCLETKFLEAISYFSKAQKLFRETGDHWEGKLVDYWLGWSNHRIMKIKVSIEQFLNLGTNCEENNYKWLQAQALSWLANNYLVQNEFSLALKYNISALNISTEISDFYNQQKIFTVQASLYGRLGNFQQALECLKQSFSLKQSYFSSLRQIWRNYIYAAEVLYQLKLYNPAIHYGQEALRIGIETLKEPVIQHNSYLYLSFLYGGAEKYLEALDYAEKSWRASQDLAEADKRILADYSILQKAHLYRQSGNCDEALKYYEGVIQAHAEENLAEYRLNVYDAHKGRLLCYLALNREELVERELSVVLDIFEKYRSQILEEQLRNTFFDNKQSVYDVAVNYAYERGNPQLAFEYAESSKARSLLDTIRKSVSIQAGGADSEIKFSNDVSRPIPFAELQKRLPEQVQIVQYAVLPDKVLIWVITKTSLQTAEKKISAGEIQERVTDYLNLITENKAEQTDKIYNEASALYEILLSPVLQLLDPEKEICFIPDKSLYHLPFASLVSPQNRRFLIQDFIVSLAPSSTVFLLATESAQRKTSLPVERVLSVGNPRFDRQTHTELPDLPEAEREAGKIAALYFPNSVSLTGKAADKEFVLRQLTNSDVFHFAGHYIPDERSPLKSTLLLAQKKSDRTGDVKVGEILGHRLSKIRLTVLSACQTGVEMQYNGEGMIGAARAFLARDVPLVVASQWAVDSQATAELMLKFHRFRKQNRLSAAAALRQAQLAMLADSDPRFHPPYFWAGFLPIGGHTLY